ncbi:MAG TPA: response regulator [Burkholderiales bacterium]|nr:response regulator [Burkholderiales bacterium]
MNGKNGGSQVSAAPRSLPVRVLLIEDSAIIRERLAESIVEPGRIEIVGQADCEGDALRALRDTPCDAVVLDLQLKQGSGLGVLKSARARPGEPVYIVFTNYDFPHYREKSAQLGASFFFDKAREHARVREVLEDMARAREEACAAKHIAS